LQPDTLMTDVQFQAANTNALRSENDMLRFVEVAFDRVAELTSDLTYTSNGPAASCTIYSAISLITSQGINLPNMSMSCLISV